MDEAEECFSAALCRAVFRDDWIMVLRGRWTYNQVTGWYRRFQAKVNEIVGGDFMKFTCEMWADPEAQPIFDVQSNTNVEIARTSAFPYLDMEWYWHQNKTLCTRVHLKANQQLLYLNRGSSHSSSCFRAIPRGVCHRLARLTSVTEENKRMTLDELYPLHFQALRHSNLFRPHQKAPSLQAARGIHQPISKTQRAIQQRQRDARRKVYFCIGISPAFPTPIWQVINELKKKHDIQWLRVSMSYHRFSNMREIFNNDLLSKLNQGIQSMDFATLECNCRGRKTKGCDYDGVCREKLVVYRAECKQTGKSYIGCTQQAVKKRFQDHYRGVQNKRRQKDLPSDSFINHFYEVTKATKDIETQDMKKLASYHILWRGDPLTAVKTFGTDRCLLCNQERLNIFKWFRLKPDKLINKCHEIYGACKHKPKFHRFQAPTSSTDESKWTKSTTRESNHRSLPAG